MLMVRDVSDFIRQMQGEPLKSKAGVKKLQDAGIDTDSKAYKVVISSMEQAVGNGLAQGFLTAAEAEELNGELEARHVD